MKTLYDELLAHDGKYKPDAWKEYTPEELQWWVHLLTKRAKMRSDPDKRDKDLADANNYFLMLLEVNKQSA